MADSNVDTATLSAKATSGLKHIELNHLKIVKKYIDKRDKEISEGLGAVASESGVMGLRVWEGKLQYKQDDGSWVDIVSVDGSSQGSGTAGSTLADESDIDDLFT